MAECNLCHCRVYNDEGEEYLPTQFGYVCVLCYRALEIHGRVWG